MKRLSIIIAILLIPALAYAYVVGTPSNMVPGNWQAYAVDPGASDSGVTSTSQVTLANLVSSIGTTKKSTIIFPHTGSGTTTQYTFATALDLSSYSNITFQFENGAQLRVSAGVSGVTLPIPANVSAQTNQQIVSGTSLYFGDSGTVHVGWFNTPEDAFDSITSNYSVIEFEPENSYTITRSMKVKKSYVTVKGNKAYISTSSDIAALDINSGSNDSLSYIKINDLSLVQTGISGTTSAYSGVSVYNVQFLNLDGIRVQGFKYGLTDAFRDRNWIENFWAYDCEVGINIFGFGSYTPISGTFRNISISKGNSWASTSSGVSVSGVSISSEINNFEFDGGSISGDFDAGFNIATGKSDNSAGLTIKRIHTEQFTAGGYIVRVDASSGYVLHGVSISENFFGSSGVTSIALEKTRNVWISNNYFGSTATTGSGVQLNNDCDNIYMMGNRYGTTAYHDRNSYASATDIYENWSGEIRHISSGATKYYSYNGLVRQSNIAQIGSGVTVDSGTTVYLDGGGSNRNAIWQQGGTMYFTVPSGITGFSISSTGVYIQDTSGTTRLTIAQ